MISFAYDAAQQTAASRSPADEALAFRAFPDYKRSSTIDRTEGMHLEKMNIFKIDDLENHTMTITRTGEQLGTAKVISQAAGLERMFIWQETLPPGRRSSSPHSHTKKEELILVQSGELSVRHGTEVLRVGAGSSVSFLPGDDLPHVVFNESNSDVVYIGIATNDPDDNVLYAADT